MHTSARRSLLSAILVLAMAGCAQSGSNGGGLVSSGHWEVSPPLHDDGMTIAMINAADMQSVMQLYCHAPSKDLVLQIAPRDLAGDAKDQSLTLAFDGGAPVAQHWQADMYQGKFLAFGLGSESPAFTPMIDALRTHRSVEITISTSGKEVRRDTVALQGAASAIDQVLTVCGRPTHA